MELKKLFQVLVVGGATLALTHCGPEQNSNQLNNNTGGTPQTVANPDGGEPIDAGADPGGPSVW